MAKQFFIPDSKHLSNDVAEQHGDIFSYLQSLLPADAGQLVKDKLVYSFSYIDSNNDEIVYTIGEDHPFKSVQVLFVFKVADVYYVFSDEQGLAPERLDFSGHKLNKVQFFD